MMKKMLSLICKTWIENTSLLNKIIVVPFFICLMIFLSTGAASASGSDHGINKIFPIILPDIKIVKGVVKSGNTISCILNKYLPLKSIYSINDLSRDIYSLARIKKGQKYKVILQDDMFVGFEYEIDKEDRLIVQKDKDGFSVSQAAINYEVELEVVSATIQYSLFEAVRNCGERNELGQKLSDIFAWDIDFIRDIHAGDQFRVLVEKRYRDGKLSGYGKIQAAFFMNKGTVFKAFLHEDANGISGYYDENGKSLQKAFLKAPLAFSRISSKFSKRRFHPILKSYRSHKGVDYAAPKGTPIKTVGDGVIVGKGYTKSTGNYITVRHYNGYTTRYFHMSKFARNMKKNKRITQGDIIGYVGSTGYATGPHLCFRLQKNGKHIDPLRHQSPSAHPVSPEEMDQYLAKTLELSRKIVLEYTFALSDKNAT